MTVALSETRYAVLNFDDAKYAGEVLDGKPHGYGVWTEYGRVYKGQWKEGKKEGLGSYQVYDKIYTGPFTTDRASGYGVIKYSNGERYEGSVLKDLPHGYGIYSYPNGDKYSGNFDLGYRSGYGSMTWKGKGSYKGLWRKGHPQTLLVEITPAKYCFTSSPAQRLNSDFHPLLTKDQFLLKHNAPSEIRNSEHCPATGLHILINQRDEDSFIKEILIFANGRREGQFNGDCLLLFKDGDYFVGKIKDCLLYGKTKGKCNDGVHFEGTISEGTFKEGKLVWQNIGVYEGLFENGAPAVNCNFNKE